MTRTPEWIVKRGYPPRKQTPPTELLTEPCRHCHVLTHVADVGLGVIHLSTITRKDGEGWRWNPFVREWENTLASTIANGRDVYRNHQCPTTPTGDAA